MVGLSHIGLRDMCRTYLPKGYKTIWPTEMLNSRRLPTQKLGNTPETYRRENETYLVPQILGNDEDFISRSLEKLHAWGADGIDINMGCPVQKALKHNYGVSLMGDFDYAAQVVEMTVRHTHLPVSVKLRAADATDPNKTIPLIKKLESAGAAWVTLHPRTATQKRRGRADWDQIRALKESIKIPVIGNGDVQTLEDFIKMKEETNCDLVMIGRAMTVRPWLFWQISEYLGLPTPIGREGSAPNSPREEALECRHALKTYLSTIQEHFPKDLGLRKFKFLIRTNHVWLNFGHTLYSQTTACKSLQECSDVIDKFFESESVQMVKKTELRN